MTLTGLRRSLVRFFLVLVTANVFALCVNTPVQALARAQGPTPTLVVGSEQDFPPFATGMTDASAGGFTVDLWKAVAAEAGLNYTIRVLPFHQLLQEFKDGRIDVLINLAQSAERHGFADFTVAHVTVHGAIFVRKGQSRIRSEDDLATKSIIVLNADLAHDYAVSQGLAKQLVLVNNAADGLRMLASGQADAMLLSKLAGLQTLQALALTNIEALPMHAGFSQKFAFATHRGQSDLLASLNEGLALTKANGVYDTLYEKWFGVYEAREVSLRDRLRYILPFLAVCLVGLMLLFRRHQRERKRAQMAIAESRDLLLTVIDNAPIRVFWKDLNLRYLGCNTVFARDAGMTHPRELIGKDDYQMGWAAQADAYRAADKAVIASGIARLSYDEPQTTPDGQTIWLRTSKVPLRNQNKEIIGLLGIYEDISAHKQATEKLQQLSIAVEQSPVSVVITDLDARIQYVNPRFTEVTGYRADEAIGQNPRILQSTLTAPETYLDMWKQLTQGLSWHGELINKRKDGSIYWEDTQIAPVKSPAGAVTHYVAIKTDITERKKLEDQVTQLAFHDALTKLPNRRLLIDRLTQAMNASKRSNRYGALMFIDLDNFKPLNDRHGHAVGDELLLEVADRLKQCVREIDTVSRFGGDEFVVLLSDLQSDKAASTAQAHVLAEKIRLALQEPYVLKAKHAGAPDQPVLHRCTASIGVVIFINHETSLDDILARADAAMYRAKDAGRNCIHFLDSGR